jgi:hypothetical protein
LVSSTCNFNNLFSQPKLTVNNHGSKIYQICTIALTLESQEWLSLANL